MVPRRSVRAPAWGLALVLLVITPAAAPITPIPPVAGVPIHLVAYQALENGFWKDGVYATNDSVGKPSVTNQMLGILANLEHVRAFPEKAADTRMRVAALWHLASEAFDPGERFFALVVPPPPKGSQCVGAPTNAWALLTALALRRENYVLPDTDWTTLIPSLRDVVESLLRTASYASKQECNAPEGPMKISDQAISLLSLLEARSVAPSTLADATIQGTLASLIRDHFNQSFADGSFYGSDVNAQLLLVLSQAVEAFPGAAYAAPRDQVADFLQRQAIRAEGDLMLVHHLEQTDAGPMPTGPPTARGQIWAAEALQQYRILVPGRVPAVLVNRLLTSYQQWFWVPQTGAFAEEQATPVSFDASALPAFLTGGVTMRNEQRDAPSLTVIVPGASRYSYPSPGSAGSASPVSSNWSMRFQLWSTADGAVGVVLPAQALGSQNLSLVEAGWYPAPALTRLGASTSQQTPVPLQIRAGPTDLLRFNTTLTSNAATYRLATFAPIRPVQSEISTSLSLALRNEATTPLSLRTIQLDAAITNVTVSQVMVNNQPLSAYRAIDAIVTENLPRPHIRIVLDGVTLPPLLDTEILVQYSDVTPPVVGDVLLSHGSDGSNPLPTREPIHVVEGERLYVRAAIADNVIVGTVLLRIQSPTGTIEKPLTEDQPGIFSGEIRAGNETGPVTLRLSAVDAAGNLETKAIVLDISNPFLSGSIVLFAFSGTLFFTTFIIWLKLRTRNRRI